MARMALEAQQTPVPDFPADRNHPTSPAQTWSKFF